MKEQFERFETFTTQILNIYRDIRKIKAGEMAEFELRGAHISCLYYLYTCEGLTATDLCEKCKEDKATVSRALDHLEKNGYLIREGDSTKRYKSPLRLTVQGAEVGRRLGEKIDHVLTEIGTVMSEEERVEFRRCLKLVSDKLDDIAGQF